MGLSVDIEAVRREIEARRQAQPKDTRQKALDELAEVLSPDLTLQKIHAFIEVLGAGATVGEHLGTITWQEVMEAIGAPTKGTLKKKDGKRRRAGKAQIERGYQALMAFMKGRKDKLSKAEIYQGILDADKAMDTETLESAWNRFRQQHLKDEGKVRNKVYWFPTRSKK
jgi:hypothetical protein